MTALLTHILPVLQQTEPLPRAFGALHLFFCCLVFLISYILVRFFRRAPEGIYRGILFLFWIVILIFEFIRQIYYCFPYSEGKFHFVFSWRNIPLQLCAMILYVLPIVIFSKKGKLHDVASLFLASFSFVAGLCVYCIPDTVFSHNVFINAQALIQHGVQIIVGVYILSREYQRLRPATFLRTFLLFTCMTLSATLLNELFYPILTKQSITPFNLFFLSRHQASDISFLEPFLLHMPYPLFLCAYLLVVTLGAYLLYSIFSWYLSHVDKP
ncbi:MAG: YwaF family protein [Clostridia bacterium]|nr:YwaF family protein [Clostridia bacterium]